MARPRTLLRCSRGRIRTFVNDSKDRRPAWLDDPGLFGSSLYLERAPETGPGGHLVGWPRSRQEGRFSAYAGLADGYARLKVGAKRVGRDVRSAIRNVEVSRILRQARRGPYEIHRPICRNSPAKPCLTYGFVGYGYVSVQALLPFSDTRGAR